MTMLVLSVGFGIVAVWFVSTITTSAIRYRKRALELAGSVQALEADLAREWALGTKLLAANEDLTREGVSDAAIIALFKNNPSMITTERVGEVLQELGVTHSFRCMGRRNVELEVVLGESGKKQAVSRSRFRLAVDLCRWCRMEHQYFEDGGHELLADREGFFLGGKRIDVSGGVAPPCVRIDSNTEEKEQ